MCLKWWECGIGGITLSLFFLVFQNYKRQAVAALGLFVRMAGHCDISEETNTAPLLINLWNLTNKHSVLDKKLLERI